ncbi:MAG: Multidrug export protein MepA [Bacteroidetes bacterium ADurb.Bin408]|nr:MAG: Multidrug export protein MepA [Bacteroidetes bacterium ADurb.Bin408]
MKSLTTGNEAKGILFFVMPMLLGSVFQLMYNVVNTWVVGNFIGKSALGAVGASFPIIFVLISLIIGISTGSTVIISQYFGAKDYEKVKLSIDTVMVFLLVTSVIITVIGLIFSKQIFLLVKLPPELMKDAMTYFNVYLSGLVLLFGYNAVSGVLRGLGDSTTPLYFLIISVVLNVILDLLFVIVFKWGIAGVAVATIISQGFSFILSVIYLNRTHALLNFSLLRLRFDREIFLKSLKISIPSGLQQTFVSIGMLALMTIVNTFGTDVIAAYTIASRIDSFALLPAMNFSMALSVFTGQNLGAKQMQRVKNGYKYTLWMTLLTSIVTTLVFLFFGRGIISGFNHDASVIELGFQYLLVVSPFYIVFSFMFINNGLLRGAGATLIPMFITLFSLWGFRVPASYFLSQWMGTYGIWTGIPVAWLFGGVCSYLYYKFGNWQKYIVVKSSIINESTEIGI